MLTNQKTTLAHYHYDALDRLTSQGQPNTPKSQRFYCESRFATEIQSGQRYSIVQSGDQLLAQQKQDSGGHKRMLLATDQLRSVQKALNGGGLIATSYTPYGYRPDDGLPSLLGFNGQRSEPVTGYYLLGNGYRAFNLVLKRFNSPDSLSPFGKGGLNSYAYCLGDPINRDDATGHAPSYLLLRMKSELVEGMSYKFQRNVTRISEGIFTSEDFTKRGSRVTFHAHGSAGVIGASKNQLIGPEQLIDLAKQRNIDVARFKSVRLLICHSADQGVNGGPSIGEQLSVRLRRPVKAYEGEVFGSNIHRTFDKLREGESYAGGYRFWITKVPNSFNSPDKNNFNYRPVNFDSAHVQKAGANIRN